MPTHVIGPDVIELDAVALLFTRTDPAGTVSLERVLDTTQQLVRQPAARETPWLIRSRGTRPFHAAW